MVLCEERCFGWRSDLFSAVGWSVIGTNERLIVKDRSKGRFCDRKFQMAWCKGVTCGGSSNSTEDGWRRKMGCKTIIEIGGCYNLVITQSCMLNAD